MSVGLVEVGLTPVDLGPDEAAAGGGTTIPLTTASLVFVPQSLQPKVALSMGSALLNFVANSVTQRLTVSVGVAGLVTVPKSLQTATLTTVGTAALQFTVQSISIMRNTLIQLGMASLNFAGKAITASGSVVSRVISAIWWY